MSDPGIGEGVPQPEQPNAPEKATPEQASELFKVIRSLTTLKGKNYGDRDTFGDKLDIVPPSVAEHFPKPQADSQSVEQSFYLTHITDKNKGVVGMATFDQHERRDANLIYATHVNYHVISDDGNAYRLERHITNTEHGPHIVGRHANKSPQEMLNELTALKARVEETRPLEEASGLLSVESQEADEIINLFKEKSNSS